MVNPRCHECDHVRADGLARCPECGATKVRLPKWWHGPAAALVLAPLAAILPVTFFATRQMRAAVYSPDSIPIDVLAESAAVMAVAAALTFGLLRLAMRRRRSLRWGAVAVMAAWLAVVMAWSQVEDRSFRVSSSGFQLTTVYQSRPLSLYSFAREPGGPIRVVSH